jgi:hypothetical protein
MILPKLIGTHDDVHHLIKDEWMLKPNILFRCMMLMCTRAHKLAGNQVPTQPVGWEWDAFINLQWSILLCLQP